MSIETARRVGSLVNKLTTERNIFIEAVASDSFGKQSKFTNGNLAK